MLIRALLIALLASSAAAYGKDIGPLDSGKAGDHVRGRPLPVTSAQITSICEAYLTDAKTNERLLQLAKQPYPTDPEDQVRWIAAFIGPDQENTLKGPFFSTVFNDHRAVLYSYVRAVLAAETMWNSASSDPDFENTFVTVLRSLEDSGVVMDYTGDITDETYPQDKTEGDLFVQTMVWALRVTAHASWALQNVEPLKRLVPKMFYYYTVGVLARDHWQRLNVPLVEDRHRIQVGDTSRVFSLITPPGPTPKDGWPTVYLFHDVTDDAVPEQAPLYTRIRAFAEAEGYQVVLAVGSPQIRASMATTAQGSLGWISFTDSVQYVRAVNDWLTAKGLLDPGNVFAIGQGNGGYFLSTALLLEPTLFKAIATYNSGLPFAPKFHLPADARKTPVMIRMGEHGDQEPATNLASWLILNGYEEEEYSYDIVPGQGARLNPDSDYGDFLKYFNSKR